MISALAGLILQAVVPPSVPVPAPPAPPAPPPPPAFLGYAPPPPPRLIQPPRAKANLGTLFNDRDYPAAALRNHEAGTVRFRLTVGKDGLVTDCAITASSGSVALDSTTCRVLTERARFTPARDVRGKPSTDGVSGRVTWRIPDYELMDFERGLFVDTMRAAPAAGTICTTVVGDGDPETTACPYDIAARMAARARATGRLQEQILVTTWTPAGQTALVDPVVRGVPAAEKDALLTVAADGSVVECRVTREVTRGTGAGRASPFDVCEEVSPGSEKVFLPAPAPGAPRVMNIRAKAYVRF